MIGHHFILKIMTEVYSCHIFAFMTYFCHIHGLFNDKSSVRNAMPNYDIVLMGKSDCFMKEFQEWIVIKAETNCALKRITLKSVCVLCIYKTLSL